MLLLCARLAAVPVLLSSRGGLFAFLRSLLEVLSEVHLTRLVCLFVCIRTVRSHRAFAVGVNLASGAGRYWSDQSDDGAYDFHVAAAHPEPSDFAEQGQARAILCAPLLCNGEKVTTLCAWPPLPRDGSSEPVTMRLQRQERRLIPPPCIHVAVAARQTRV